MKALIIAAGLLLPMTARADEAPPCRPMAELQKEIQKHLPSAKIAKMTSSQFHFAQGLYASDPNTPQGIPDADGVVLVEAGEKTAFIWTKGGQACRTEPLGGASVVKLLDQIKDGPGDAL